MNTHVPLLYIWIHYICYKTFNISGYSTPIAAKFHKINVTSSRYHSVKFCKEKQTKSLSYPRWKINWQVACKQKQTLKYEISVYKNQVYIIFQRQKCYLMLGKTKLFLILKNGWIIKRAEQVKDEDTEISEKATFQQNVEFLHL